VIVLTGRLRPRAAPVRLAGAVLAAAAALWLFDPNTHPIPLCPLHAMTGLWCPFCGSTRAGHALLHAHLVTALHDNALVVIALPVLALWWWRSAASQQLARRLPRPVFWAGAVLALAFGVVRNLAIARGLAPPG